MLTKQISRRDFLKTSGALVVTYALAPKAAHAAIDPNDLGPKTVAADRVDGFVAIDSKGVVTVYSGKVDLGTGTDTALTQIAAEELGVPMQRVKLVTGDTLLTPDQGPTFGSLTIQNGGVQIRQACATAREALLDRAAQKLGVSRSDLAVQDGWIRGNGKGVAYAELVGDHRLELKLGANAPLNGPPAYTIVGRVLERRFRVELELEPESAAQGPFRLHDRRQAGTAPRHPGESHRALHLHAGPQGQGH